LNTLSARANAGTVGVIAGGIDGTYARIAADLAAVLDEPDGLRVLPILGKGSVQNISDILALRGVDVGIVQSDVLAYARRERLLPGVEQFIQYIAKLYDEEVHVLAAPGITALADLAGKPVNVDGRGSGTAMTATILFDGIAIEPRYAPQDTALEQLRRGEIAALVYVAGKPARLFTGIPAESRLHFLPVPATPALLETYLPSTLAPTDYPTLVGGAPVETIAVGAVMAAYAWPQATERHRKVARFVEAFFTKFPDFLRPPRHPKWREVNLAAQVPGWTRFGPAAAHVAKR
ncbi:MAG: TRAP transporter substrate-binding protein, partial [Acetobacteraceae bacterium]